MRQKNNNKDELSQLRLIFQELKVNPISKLNVSFALMSIIPFLVFFYLLSSRFVTIKLIFDNTVLIICVTIFLSLCGFSIAYRILMGILKTILHYAASAKRSDELKSTFVATVAHDLNSPLSIVKMNIYSLRSGILGNVSEKQEKILGTCHGILERMTRLITDLLDVYKFEAKVVSLKRNRFNLDETIERQINELEPLIHKKGLTLTREISKEKMELWGDENRIAQVLNNLISNAIKYIREGDSLTIRAFETEGVLRFECCDTGPGIPAEKMSKIFNKFERFDMSKEGTGLGLAISKDIIELHKGRIWVESEQGKGSNFIFVLPKDFRVAEEQTNKDRLK